MKAIGNNIKGIRSLNFFFIASSLLFFGCSNSEMMDYSWDMDDIDEEIESNSLLGQNYTAIPYTEDEDNTIMLPVKINGVGLDMIFDTGASSTCITLAEALYLYGKGLLRENDIGDEELFQTADGSISVGLRVILSEVVIGDAVKLNNVEAVVVEDLQAPLLLGQSVLRNFKEVSVDRENNVVKFYN